jgi:hypothetical protein
MQVRWREGRYNQTALRKERWDPQWCCLVEILDAPHSAFLSGEILALLLVRNTLDVKATSVCAVEVAANPRDFTDGIHSRRQSKADSESCSQARKQKHPVYGLSGYEAMKGRQQGGRKREKTKGRKALRPHVNSAWLRGHRVTGHRSPPAPNVSVSYLVSPTPTTFHLPAPALHFALSGSRFTISPCFCLCFCLVFPLYCVPHFIILSFLMACLT